MEYKWITQQPNGFIKLHPTAPFIDRLGDDAWNCDNAAWESVERFAKIGAPMLCINLQTHDYKIEDGVLMQVPKPNRHKYADIFIEAANDTSKTLQARKIGGGEWADFNPREDENEYRIKPEKKTIRFRNYLDTDGQVQSTDNDFSKSSLFVKWIGDWHKVEI